MLLNEAFYRRNGVTRIAQQLLGKGLFTKIDGKVTGGLIVETEAYSWKERGCHAYNKRMTPRNEVMFRNGGLAYVYLCYGIHQMFNVVTNREGQADAVLIRALEPVEGIKEMMKRSGATSMRKITSGPGKLTKAMGIDRKHNGMALTSKSLWLADLGPSIKRKDILESPRIGIDYAGKDALLPWRYTIADSPWITQ
jgi:DNA-3-methyladenine glycosylase